MMTCDKCGVTIVRGDYIQSKFTKKRYCKRFDECDKRQQKKEKRGKEQTVRS